MRGFNVSACTDVTGFGLLCHLLEMCGNNVSAEIWPDSLPVIREAEAYADDFLLTAAAQRNRNHFGKTGQVEKLPFAAQELMFDPQTSGGLLICVDSEQSQTLLDAIQKDDPDARIIGRIIDRQDDIITFGGKK
jgi:selenide,water dikinase